ncbi:MAG: tryptophan 2,3-dioxygenase family protein [Acidobacteriota bacterium]
MASSLTYSRYLELDRLLELQIPRSGEDWEDAEHDELLFIVIHQVYELWFKQTLHELDHLGELLDAHRPPERDTSAKVRMTLQRVLTILKTMVAQVDILETMTPISFGSFRARLDASSGFQSPQFRELEFLLGHRRRGMLKYHEDNPPALARLQRRLEEPPIYHLFLRFLHRSGADVPAQVLDFDPDHLLLELPEIHGELVRIYREDDPLMQICERLVDFDEGLQEWRYRHVKMVERTIGRKPGTGGSAGAEYLRGTLFHPVFPDLWAIRSQL